MDSPRFFVDSGSLVIESLDYNTYGFWESSHDLIAYVPDSIYRARFTIRGTAAQDEAPTLRCRINTESSTVTGVLVAKSWMGGDTSPGEDAQIYTVYFDPIDQSIYQDEGDQDDLFVSIDLLSFYSWDNPYGAFYIDSVEIDRIDQFVMPEGETVKVYDTTGDFSNWMFGGASSLFDLPLSSVGNGSLTLTANNDNANTYGFWESSRTANEVDIERDKLYRVLFTVSSTADQEFSPMLRLRIATESNKMTYMYVVFSNLEGSNSPASSGTTYQTLFYPPQSDAESGESTNGLVFGMDLLNFLIAQPDDPNGDLTLERVEVQSIDMSDLP